MEQYDQMEKKFEELGASAVKNDDLKLLKKTQLLGKEYKEKALGLNNAFRAMEQNSRDGAKAAAKVTAGVKETMALGIRDASAVADNTASNMGSASKILGGGLIAAIIIGALVALFMTKGISNSMKAIINGMLSAASQISAAAAQQSEGSQILASGAGEQASSLEETGAALEQLSSMTKQNTTNTRSAKEKANKAREVANSGRSAMERLSKTIEEITASANQTATIIKAIDEIAFQTNLLALNAAVEAARAGDSGKGFAVVADEVRALAQRSAEAARNTGELIKISQDNANNGVGVVKEVGSILDTITEEADSVAQLINQIATASEEQMSGLGEINTAVANVDKVTQTTASSAEESAASSEQLSAQARELNDLVRELQQMISSSEDNKADAKAVLPDHA